MSVVFIFNASLSNAIPGSPTDVAVCVTMWGKCLWLPFLKYHSWVKTVLTAHIKSREPCVCQKDFGDNGCSVCESTIICCVLNVMLNDMLFKNSVKQLTDKVQCIKCENRDWKSKTVDCAVSFKNICEQFVML